MLKKADTQDCKQADSQLINLTELVLYDARISDLRPLAGLTKLTSLVIEGDSNLQPLAGLTNLTNLKISGDKISDLQPLTGLTNLTYLKIYGNQITNVNSVQNPK